MQRRYFALIFSGALLLSLFSQIAVAQGNSQGKGKGKNKHQQMVEDEDAGSYQRGGVRIVFSTHDRDMIRDYYRDSYSNLPPGLAKRGGNLPPGLQKRVQPFPVELERRLPPLPDGYRRVTLGVDILILDRRTQRIMDIVHDILRP